MGVQRTGGCPDDVSNCDTPGAALTSRHRLKSMTSLDDFLPEEFRTPEARLYRKLAREDQRLLGELVEIRKLRGLTQEQVADSLGLSQATISAFERIGNDPHLSTLRRYCRAIGVMVTHHLDADGLDCDVASHYISHVTDKGVHSHATAEAIVRGLDENEAPAWPDSVFSPKILADVSQ